MNCNLALSELGGFLHADHVVILPLIAVYVLIVVAITEFDATARSET
jgi:hypothetical protein